MKNNNESVHKNRKSPYFITGLIVGILALLFLSFDENVYLSTAEVMYGGVLLGFLLPKLISDKKRKQKPSKLFPYFLILLVAVFVAFPAVSFFFYADDKAFLSEKMHTVFTTVCGLGLSVTLSIADMKE